MTGPETALEAMGAGAFPSPRPAGGAGESPSRTQPGGRAAAITVLPGAEEGTGPAGERDAREG